MDIKVIVATHKAYWMPDDDIYLPLHVGKEGKKSIGYIGDNTGENISKKNANYHNKHKNFKQKSKLDGKLFSIPYVL